MAYISICKNREGKSYVYLSEGYRVGNKTRTRNLISYGKLDDLIAKDPNIIEKLKADAKKGILGGTPSSIVNIQIDTAE